MPKPLLTALVRAGVAAVEAQGEPVFGCLRGCLRDRFSTPFPASENIPKSLILLVPVERIELPTFGLQNRCSTAELNRQIERDQGRTKS